MIQRTRRGKRHKAITLIIIEGLQETRHAIKLLGLGEHSLGAGNWE